MRPARRSKERRHHAPGPDGGRRGSTPAFQNRRRESEALRRSPAAGPRVELTRIYFPCTSVARQPFSLWGLSCAAGHGAHGLGPVLRGPVSSRRGVLGAPQAPYSWSPSAGCRRASFACVPASSALRRTGGLAEDSPGFDIQIVAVAAVRPLLPVLTDCRAAAVAAPSVAAVQPPIVRRTGGFLKKRMTTIYVDSRKRVAGSDSDFEVDLGEAHAALQRYLGQDVAPQIAQRAAGVGQLGAAQVDLVVAIHAHELKGRRRSWGRARGRC